jgi:mitochondrial chaperone BCS1
MWMHREIAMNLHVVETVRLSSLFGTRRQMETLLEAVQHHASAQRHNRLVLHTIDRWGEAWQLADTKPRRPLESVVLDEGAAHRLLDDIHEFFARREWYERMGIPWRRGYLLHGPPGTGKTSVAYALAGELKLNLCALSLTNPKLNDHTLADLLQRTPPRSLILIEDIDAFFRERDKQDPRVPISFSGLLNALDGVGAQEGRIVVLTTNHRERLDAALIRPGRIDVEVELGNASKQQLRTLFLRFHADAVALADALAAEYPAGSLSPARIQQALLEGDTSEQAAQQLRVAWASSAATPAPSPLPSPP